MSSRASGFWNGDEVGGALGVGAVGADPATRVPGEAGERHVHVVGGAAHQPHRRRGDAGQPVVAAQQVVHRPRDHVAHVDRLARLRVGHQAVRLALELPIEDRCHRRRRLGERRMVGDVADPFVTDPDVGAAPPMPSGTDPCPRPHGQPSLRDVGAVESSTRRDCPGRSVQVSIVNRQYGRRITGIATLRTGTPPGVVPHSIPPWACPWSARSAPTRSIASPRRWLPRNG